MSIYAKLAQARVMLQDEGLQKTGKNYFIQVKTAKTLDNGKIAYENGPMPYFELGDFLPKINKIFNELKMCSVVSFTEQLATLTIFDAESDGKVEFTSPMPKVPTQNAKGDIGSNALMQSIGALETYQRRYLYVSALEIVESDAIDSQDFSQEKNDTVQKKQESQKRSSESASPSSNYTQGDYSAVVKKLKQKLEDKSKEELSSVYNMSIKYLQEKYPDLIDEYNLMYNDYVLNLM